MKQIALGTRDGNVYSLSEKLNKNGTYWNIEMSNKESEKAILWHHHLWHATSKELIDMKTRI
jgi:hypothetical protein